MVRINNAESERLILQANNQNVSIISLNSKNCAQNMKGRWDESEFSGGPGGMNLEFQAGPI